MDNATNTSVKGSARSTAPPATSGDSSIDTGGTLTVTYNSTEDGGEIHYAVIPFPKLYEQAVAAALRLLGKYMGNPQAAEVILRSSARNQTGERVWADFEPADWLLVVRPDEQVRLFEKRLAKPVAPTTLFWGGPVYLVFGERKASITTWTEFNPTNTHITPCIDRPTSYAEAVEMTKDCASNHKTYPVNFSSAPIVKRVIEPGKTLTFYIFNDNSLRQWIPFPSSALTDDAVWKAIVPESTGILGVMAT
ncbi:hypothetical protein C8R44DRAFT_787220 [Mycena epipterygia]|nr:hypothetical protein C8R44DRAFT_787220 [Mycena epipterygia]